jgi:hypothetical protein
MKQSRRVSLIEAIANVLAGYGLAVLTQTLVFPIFGLQITLSENLTMGLVFTIVSLARSYALRRAFEAIRVRGVQTQTAGRKARRHRPRSSLTRPADRRARRPGPSPR